ncbi:MAG TPA: hypothetical protein VG457_13290, partial [Planctomycetota bacterium]|nr:hypothetical protein [Planctomycetota bacterium]
PKDGGPHQFTEDDRKAWEWADQFLRRLLAPDWFGFSRLTPEDEKQRELDRAKWRSVHKTIDNRRKTRRTEDSD